jgi:hypothetical protein
MLYFAYFHSVIRYGIIFWGIATNSYKVSKLQKSVIRIMSGAKPGASCRGLFRRLEILPVPCQYTRILSLMLFIIDNPNNFQTVSEVHGLHTRSQNQLFIANANLTSVQKCYKAAVLGEDDKKDAVLYFQWINVVVSIICTRQE